MLRKLDAPSVEQVVAAPKISLDRVPLRSAVRRPQKAEQLVEVPTEPGYSLAHLADFHRCGGALFLTLEERKEACRNVTVEWEGVHGSKRLPNRTLSGTFCMCWDTACDVNLENADGVVARVRVEKKGRRMELRPQKPVELASVTDHRPSARVHVTVAEHVRPEGVSSRKNRCEESANWTTIRTTGNGYGFKIFTNTEAQKKDHKDTDHH